jgi:pyrrolysine biosynthesis protein PylC
MATKICIVGGKLQGMEAAYLSGKAGYTTVLMDKKPCVPASTLVDEFLRVDVVEEQSAALKAISNSDAVLPALEDSAALKALSKLCNEAGVSLMHDSKAYAVTSSKEAFARFCKENGVPIPEIPRCPSFPAIVKPVNGSGSRGVSLVRDNAELNAAIGCLKGQGAGYIVQEYAPGHFLSLELLGLRGSPLPIQVTSLEFDESYGCKRVIAPCPLGGEALKGTIEQGKRVAEGLRLTGLTDIQTVLTAGRVETIEANARLPSQTPTAVYHSTGVNMVELMASLFTDRSLPRAAMGSARAVIYQHLLLEGRKLKVTAEHALSSACGMRVEKGFYGADEAITNLPNESAGRGVATLITSGASLKEAKGRMEEAVKSIASDYRATVEDISPWGMESAYDAIDA